MRRSIAILATSSLLPLVVLSALFCTASLHGERQSIEAEAHAHAAFSATLISNRLESEERQVAMVALSPALDRQVDAPRFQLLASRLIQEQPTWRTLSIARPDGERLLDAPVAIGGKQHGPVVDPASLAAAVASRRPVVGQVRRGPAGGLAFAIRAPVVRGDHVPYVVSAVVPSTSLAALLRFQPLSPGWRAGLVDGSGHVIASSDPHAPELGRMASAPALLARARGESGLYRFTRLSGVKAEGVFARVPGTDWTVHVSAPETVYAGPIHTAFLLLAGSAALCLTLFTVLARLLQLEWRQSRTREAAASQAQRMEALGRLTGGVAHDLNNLLTPIIGGLDLLHGRAKDDPRSLKYIQAARLSAERAKTLVGRLLAFSRRQTLQPDDVDLGKLLSGLADLLEGSLPPGVTLRLDCSPGTFIAHVDPSQLELAILNLAINGRDAMPDGGELVIGCAVAAPDDVQGLPSGRYVSLTVSDTGVGMSEATLQRAIEPFFTTKPADKGTGLGLSMAHGFAAQSGGALRLRSAVGRGAQATIVLPAAMAEAATRASPVAASAPDRGWRVLLVDDDDAVRATTEEMLATRGHQVVAVSSADAALAELGDGRRFDLVVTDYLMPGRSGGDLARELKARWPALAVVIVTGYMGEPGDIPPRTALLRKPFAAPELSNLLAEAVAAHRGGA